MSARGRNDLGECAFCGAQCGGGRADMMAEFHAAFEELVHSAPAPPYFYGLPPDYVEALTEARRILDIHPSGAGSG